MPARDGLKPGCRDLPNLTSPVCAMKPSMTRWNDDAVIGAFARQLLDARDVARRQVGQQLDHDVALGGVHEERVFAVLDLGHVGCLPSAGEPSVSSTICRRRCWTLIMRSGSLTTPFCASSPFLMASTSSMPLTTLPTIVYWPSRHGAVGEHDEELRVGRVRVLRSAPCRPRRARSAPAWRIRPAGRAVPSRRCRVPGS